MVPHAGEGSSYSACLAHLGQSSQYAVDCVAWTVGVGICDSQG